MQKKLDAYRGKLSAAEVAKGMTVAVRNARRLADDAATLLAAGSFPTAASLAARAIEEAGKASILRALALARNDAEIKDEWRAYRSHTSKNVTWILPELAAAGARKLDDLRPLFDQDSDHPFFLDQLKQLGFHTDCLRATNTTQQIEDFRLSRGVKPKAVAAYDKAKQRRIRGCVSSSKCCNKQFSAHLLHLYRFRRTRDACRMSSKSI